MFYLENNFELNSEAGENSPVYYVLHYNGLSLYEDDHVYTKDGGYVKVSFFNNVYTLMNEPKEHQLEVNEFLNKLN